MNFSNSLIQGISAVRHPEKSTRSAPESALKLKVDNAFE